MLHNYLLTINIQKKINTLIKEFKLDEKEKYSENF